MLVRKRRKLPYLISVSTTDDRSNKSHAKILRFPTFLIRISNFLGRVPIECSKNTFVHVFIDDLLIRLGITGIY